MDGKLFTYGSGPEPTEAQRRAKRKRLRQKRVEERGRRWVRPSDWLMHLLSLIMALTISIYAGILFERFGDPLLALRHMASFPNCAATRAMGLAPAALGEPGYYRGHDRDRDGIACEPYP